mgnify:FL=1
MQGIRERERKRKEGNKVQARKEEAKKRHKERKK